MREKDTRLPDRRVWALEYLRILAAFGIVWFHNSLTPLNWVGLFGLWVFLLISFSLLSRTVPNQPFAAFVAAKARRVMVPWAFWSALYLSLSLARFWRHGTPFFEEWMLLAGFSLHLWYLPYLFGVSVALSSLRRSHAAVDGPAGVWFFAVAGLAMLAVNGVWCPATPPFAQWMTAVPVTLLGYALGRITMLPDARSKGTALLTLTLCVTAMCVARICMPGNYSHDGVTVLLGFGAFVAAGALPLPPMAAVRLLSPLTLGIYLIHPLIVDMLSRLIGESGSPFRVVLVFAASAAAVYGMKKIPILRSVV